MSENEIAKQIVDAAYSIHSKLGPGLLESVYELLLADELKRRGFRACRQVPVHLEYEGRTFEEAFRADIVVEDKVIIEL